MGEKVVEPQAAENVKVAEVPKANIIIKQGIMLKQGGGTRTFGRKSPKKRWFVLHVNQKGQYFLKYYEVPTNKEDYNTNFPGFKSVSAMEKKGKINKIKYTEKGSIRIQPFLVHTLTLNSSYISKPERGNGQQKVDS